MIKLHKITKKYGDTVALNDFSLDIPEGILLVLLGPSGCGKSTVIKLINHLITPTSGEIFINNRNIKEMDLTNLRRGIGYVIQSVGLFPHYNVYENIATVPRLLKWPENEIDRRVDYLLELVGLSKNNRNKFPAELSGGEGQRVGVARALAADPPILLMDEPFGSVDPLNRERLQKEFYRIQKQLKKTVLLVTHDVEEAIRLGDQIAIMRPGHLASLGNPAHFIAEKEEKYVKEFLGDEYPLKLLSRLSVQDIMDWEVVKDSGDGNGDVSTLQIYKESNVSSALSLMITKGINVCQVIDEEQNIVGTFTFEDILKKAFSGEKNAKE